MPRILTVLRALGAGPAMTSADALIGVLGAVVAGSLLAAGVAMGLSPLAPLGPARPYLPVSVSVDWTVIGLSLAVLIVALSGVSFAVVYSATGRRAWDERERASNRGSALVRTATAAGLPPPASKGSASLSNRAEVAAPYLSGRQWSGRRWLSWWLLQP